MSLRAKRESVFISDVPPGPHLFSILNAKTFAKSNGDPILHEGNPGLVLTFTCDAGTHQELYWIEGYNYIKLLKLLSQIGVSMAGDVQKKDLLRKQFWGLIIEHKTMRGVDEIKSERKLTETHPLCECQPFSKQEFVIYKEDKFEQEGPAF